MHISEVMSHAMVHCRKTLPEKYCLVAKCVRGAKNRVEADAHFEIAVQMLVGRQFWCIGRKAEDFDFLAVLSRKKSHESKFSLSVA